MDTTLCRLPREKREELLSRSYPRLEVRCVSMKEGVFFVMVSGTVIIPFHLFSIVDSSTRYLMPMLLFDVSMRYAYGFAISLPCRVSMAFPTLLLPWNGTRAVIHVCSLYRSPSTFHYTCRFPPPRLRYQHTYTSPIRRPFACTPYSYLASNCLKPSGFMTPKWGSTYTYMYCRPAHAARQHLHTCSLIVVYKQITLPLKQLWADITPSLAI